MKRLLVAFAVTFAAATSAAAEPSAQEVLGNAGISQADQKKVLDGQFVPFSVPVASERDLSIGLVFFVKEAPDALVREIETGKLLKDDPQVKSGARFSGAGSPADLSSLTLSADEASELGKAKAGSSMNFSTAVFAALKAASGGGQSSVEQTLRQLLLARYQAYAKAGLGGIAGYDRDGSIGDVAGDLRKASESMSGLKKYLPGFQKVLLDYPNAKIDGETERNFWVKYDIDGTTTFVLTHGLTVTDGAARVVVQRQYYASTGYNAEQAVAAFLPATGGTVVLYVNHTFTDQVAGFGGSAKRSIGRGIMTKKLEAMFSRTQERIAK